MHNSPFPEQPVFLNVEFIFSWLTSTFGFIFSPSFVGFLQFLASILIIIGITVILYCLVRLNEIKQEDKKAKQKASMPLTEVPLNSHSGGSLLENLPGAGPRPKNETWEHIRGKLLSDSPSDWRLAIIEADIYMDRLFDSKGFPGDTIGDKLKKMSEGDLPSLQVAWEAHKVRNRIAHEGASFSLTMPEARRILSYYEIVFRDLGAIE